MYTTARHRSNLAWLDLAWLGLARFSGASCLKFRGREVEVKVGLMSDFGWLDTAPV